MSRKNISDIQVLQAIVKSKESPIGERKFPYEILAEQTGECEKVCYRAMKRAHERGYIEYGVSLRTGWLTDKGKELLGT